MPQTTRSSQAKKTDLPPSQYNLVSQVQLVTAMMEEALEDASNKASEEGANGETSNKNEKKSVGGHSKEVSDAVTLLNKAPTRPAVCACIPLAPPSYTHMGNPSYLAKGIHISSPLPARELAIKKKKGKRPGYRHLKDPPVALPLPQPNSQKRQKLTNRLAEADRRRESKINGVNLKVVKESLLGVGDAAAARIQRNGHASVVRFYEKYNTQSEENKRDILRASKIIPYDPAGTAVLDDGGRLLIFVSGEGEAQLASRGYPILNALNPVMISQKTEKFNEKRDTAISNTVGFHTAYTAKASILPYSPGLQIHSEVLDILPPFLEHVKKIEESMFPQQVTLRNEFMAPFGGNELACLNSPPLLVDCLTCRLKQRKGAVHTRPHVDSKNDPMRCCKVMALGNFDARFRHLIAFPDLKIIVEVPSGATAFYGSSLLLHFNVNLLDIHSETELQQILGLRSPYTAEMDQENADSEARFSLILYNQGTVRRLLEIERGFDVQTGLVASEERLDEYWKLSEELEQKLALD